MPQADPGTASEPPADATISARNGLLVGGAAALSAATAFVVLTLAVRTLGTPGSADFQIFWAALFTCFGVLTGLSTETTRSVAAAVDTGRHRGPRVVLFGLVTGLVLAAVLAATMPLWRGGLTTTSATSTADTRTTAWALVVGVAAFAMHSVLTGSLAGTRRWAVYSATISAESLMRFGLAVVVLAVGASVGGLALGSACAAATWMVVLAVSRSARRAIVVRADVPAVPFVRRMLATFLAQGSSALLVVGFPLLMGATTSNSVMAASGALMYAMTLTRAPLLVPLNAYQGVAVTHFVRHRDEGLRAALPALRLIALVGLVGAALAALVGPWLFEVVSRGEHVSGPVLAGLTVGAAMIAVLTLTGALCQALDLHRWYLAGWLTATGAATALLLLPGSVETRVVVSLVGGPLVGIAVHLVGLRRRPSPASDAPDASAPITPSNPTNPSAPIAPTAPEPPR